MELSHVLKLRRSIRKFALKGVSMQEIGEICQAAMLAPAAGNIPTIHFIIVSKKETIKLLASACQQPFLVQAPYVIVVYSDPRHVVRSYGKKRATYTRQQAGAAIENMLLRATDLELGACWVGWFDEDMVKRAVFIPVWGQVEALIPVGHPNEDPIPRKKKDLKLVTRFEQYGYFDSHEIKKPIKKVFA